MAEFRSFVVAAALCAGCASDPTPQGLALTADAEMTSHIGAALRDMKAPRLAVIGRALANCSRGARLRSATVNLDALDQSIACDDVKSPGLVGTWRSGDDVWRLTSAADGGLTILPPPSSLVAPTTHSVVGFRNEAAFFSVAWAAPAEALAGLLKGDLTTGLLSPLLDGSFAVVALPGPTPRDFPQLAGHVGLRAIPFALLDRLAEDAAKRLGTTVTRSGEGEGLRWCLEGLAVVPGLAPCLQKSASGVLVAFNVRTLDQVVGAVTEPGPARIVINLAAIDENDRRRAMGPMGWPFASVTVTSDGTALRVAGFR
jgi:hypothetical protein